MRAGEVFCYLLLNGFRFYVIYRFMGVFFGREDKKENLFCLYAAYLLVNIMTYFVLKGSDAALILDRICHFFVIAAGYRGAKQKKLSEDEEEQNQKEMYELQLQMYQRQLNAMQNTNDAYRILRHDMKQHVDMVSEYIDHGEYEKASEYLRKINQYAGTDNRYVETGNGCIDCILNYTMDKISEIDGKATLDVGMMQGIAVDDFDINMILGNLMRNACEALRESKEKELTVYMKYDQGVINIRVKNTYNGRLREKEGRIMTTKEDNGCHGIGLVSVKKAVEKYNGNMKIRHTREEFQVSILLYAPQEEEADSQQQVPYFAK